MRARQLGSSNTERGGEGGGDKMGARQEGCGAALLSLLLLPLCSFVQATACMPSLPHVCVPGLCALALCVCLSAFFPCLRP